MAVVMVIDWPELTREQYAALRTELDWVGNKPEGGRLHVAGWGEGGFRAVDIWDSPEAWGRFGEARLMPAAQKLGLTSQPTASVSPAEFLDLLAYREL